MGDIDIFGDDGADGYVGPRDQFINPGAQDRAHRFVEPGEVPALGQLRGDGGVDLVEAGGGALHDIVEEIDLGLGIFRVLDRRAEPVLVEFVQQRGDGGALHVMLV